jgi:hypothetical protein
MDYEPKDKSRSGIQGPHNEIKARAREQKAVEMARSATPRR